VSSRFTFNTSSTLTKQDSALWAVVRTKVSAIPINHAVNCCKSATGLVTYGTQVASAAIECYAFESIEFDRSCGFKRPIITSVGGVDLMAGAAILMGYISSCAIIGRRGLTSSNHFAEGSARVTTGTTITATSIFSSSTATMDRG
jgi:hypothetical protein